MSDTQKMPSGILTRVNTRVVSETTVIYTTLSFMFPRQFSSIILMLSNIFLKNLIDDSLNFSSITSFRE